jgi:FkbM family methyltransferase
MVIGTDYGAWAVPNSHIHSESVVYCFGVGEDISFDLGLIEATNCTVHAFDPTPFAGAWLKRQALPQAFRFHDVGLAGHNGYATFHAPLDDQNYRSVPAGRGSIECPVRRLASIMDDLHHTHIDLLKMDIEGFEYDALSEFLSAGVRPKVLNVEFHHKAYGIDARRTREAVAAIRHAGYRIYWVSDLGREYGFVRA